MAQKAKVSVRRAWTLVGMVALLAGLMIAALYFGKGRPDSSPAEPTEEPIPHNRYSPQDFVYRGDYLTCTAGNTVLGIDVSHHQGDIDWAKVKDSGVRFVMVRLGNRGYTSGALAEDRCVRQNLEGARQAGLLVGAYFYSQAISVEEAREEAALALEILDGFRLDLPLAYDWEQEARTASVDARLLTDCTLAFCRDVENAGYKAMIYFNSYQAVELLYLRELTAYPWWLAMYDITQVFPHRMDMWQYTRTGSVPGISGNVDINLWFFDGLI